MPVLLSLLSIFLPRDWASLRCWYWNFWLKLIYVRMNCKMWVWNPNMLGERRRSVYVREWVHQGECRVSLHICNLLWQPWLSLQIYLFSFLSLLFSFLHSWSGHLSVSLAHFLRNRHHMYVETRESQVNIQYYILTLTELNLNHGNTHWHVHLILIQ